LMYVFVADAPVAAPVGFSGHHVSEVRQARWDELRPHPTDMRILNDAGVAEYPEVEVEAELARDGIVMTRYHTVSQMAGIGALARG